MFKQPIKGKPGSNPPGVEVARFNCPNPTCGAALEAPFPQPKMMNAPDVTMVVAVHQDDDTCLVCPHCDMYLVPALTPNSNFAWSWVPAEKPKERSPIIIPQIGLGR